MVGGSNLVPDGSKEVSNGVFVVVPELLQVCEV